VDYIIKYSRIILEYISYPSDSEKWNVLEKFEFDEYGKIMKSSVYYGLEE
jgi:hypothetical protein